MLSLRLLRSSCKLISSHAYSNVATASSAKLQELALEEKCILVNERDQYTGSASKRDCHRVDPEEGEREELNAIGIRRAAQRRLNYELGIPMAQARPENFHFLTRIHYADRGDGTWGEHEIDYILFLQKDVDLKPNESEVSEVRYIPRKGMNDTIANLDAPLTPWFRLILQHRLQLWWDNLHMLDSYENHKKIERF
uniref:isopentenyl-diphosphate Delta-isomerase n=1 Tax=Anopheles culicifacies TaxID=139723 RepID=A0A182M9T9_9DIPT